MSSPGQPAAQDPAGPRRVGLFGGSFDPVHRTHLAVARAALDQAGLDELVFIPSARTPLKGHAPVASAADRLEMLRLATAAEPRFRIDDCELRAGGTSYTVGTLRALDARHPGTDWHWLMGADQLAQFTDWRDAGELARRMRFLVVARPGVSPQAPDLPEFRLQTLELPADDTSSTEVRRRCRAGLPIAGLVPASVEAFISDNAIYSPPQSRPSH